MKETVNGKILWQEAGRTGLILGGVVIIYSLLSSLTSGLGMFSGVLSFILWAGKFGGCLYLMHLFMVRLSQHYDGVTKRTAFGYGVRIALLSALVCSAYALIQAILYPEAIEQAFDLIQETFASYGMLDSNSIAVMEKMQQNYPAYMFFSNMVYCFLFGVIVAKIFSSKFPQDDPFGDTDPKF